MLRINNILPILLAVATIYIYLYTAPHGRLSAVIHSLEQHGQIPHAQMEQIVIVTETLALITSIKVLYESKENNLSSCTRISCMQIKNKVKYSYVTGTKEKALTSSPREKKSKY
jgi:hypothetical protein